MPFRSAEKSGFAARGNSARRGKVKSGIGLFSIYFPQHGIKRSQVKIRKNRGKSAKNIMGLRTRLPDMKYARVWPDSARGAIMLCGQHRPGGRADLTAATEPCVGEQSPHVRTGDIVIIRHQPIAADGDIVAASVNNEVTLKRLVNRPDRIALEAENPEFKPIELTRYDSFRVIGKMVGIIKQEADNNGGE